MDRNEEMNRLTLQLVRVGYVGAARMIMELKEKLDIASQRLRVYECEELARRSDTVHRDVDGIFITQKRES